MAAQTILGAGGTIGRLLASELRAYTTDIRLVSRSPEAINPDDELISADLLDAAAIRDAVTNSEVAYLTAGLPYSAKVWEKQWPVVMKNVIDACAEQDVRLVFFDNVYMYDRAHLGHMDETTPVNPTSRKGAVRMHIARMLMEATEQGRVQALIARSADFYGPDVRANGVLRETVFNNLVRGKAAQWLRSIDFKHSFTFTPDAARGTAMLGNTPDTFGQIWHLPTAPAPLSGREWIEAIAEALGVQAKWQVVPQFMMNVLGLFVPVMKELAEMSYQYDRDYIFMSDKFNEYFNFIPVDYKTGIQEIVNSDYSDGQS